MKKIWKSAVLLLLCGVCLSACAVLPQSLSQIEDEQKDKEAVFAYRPDLEWIPEGGMRFVSAQEKIRFEVKLVEDESALYPVEIYVEGVEGEEAYIPAAYVESLGWEKLPADAWQHISGGVEGKQYYAATADQIFGYSLTDMLLACKDADFTYADLQVHILQLEQPTQE